MADNMQLVITANVAQATTALNQTQKELAATAMNANKADSAIQNLGKSAAPVSAAITKTSLSSAGASGKFAQLSTSVASVAGNFEELGSLSQLASFGVAGLGAAALTAAIAFVKYVTELSNAEQAQNDLNQSLDNSAASVAGNVARLTALVSIAQDVTKSDAERKEAIGALNKEYDGFNKTLDISNINTAASIDLINKQTAALVRQAQIKGLENLITKESEKQAEILNSKLEDNLTLLDKAKIAALGGIGGVGLGANKGALIAIDNVNQGLKDSDERIKIFSESLKRLLGEEALAGTLFEEKNVKAKATTIKRELLSVDDVLAKLARQIELLNTKEITLGTNETKAKVSAIESTIEQLVKQFKVDPKDTIIQKLFGDVQSLNFSQFQKDLNVQARKLRLEPVPLPVEPYIDIGKFDPFPNRDQPVFGTKSKEDAFKFLDDLNARVKVTQETFASVFTAIGNGIGQSILEGASILKGGFEALLHIMGAFLVKMGEAAIRASVLAVAIKKLFKNPITGLIAGVAAVAIGTILSNIQLPAFANGIDNFGGGMAVVGERGPEIVRLPRGSDVIPNHQLGGISGGSPIVMIADTRISGNDIVISYKRASKTISQNG